MGTETQVSHRQQYENKMKEDYGSYRRNFYRCEKKAWKNSGLYGIRTLDLCAIPVQRSTNRANKPTGSRTFSWFVINPWKDDDEEISIWKSYMETTGWRIKRKKIIAVIDPTFTVRKRNPEKKSFEDSHMKEITALKLEQDVYLSSACNKIRLSLLKPVGVIKRWLVNVTHTLDFP